MAKNNTVTYKGFPIMRCNNEYYYGYAADPVFILMTVMSYIEVEGEKIPDNISITLMSSDQTLPIPKRILKRGDKKGLSSALELSHIWLSRELNPSENDDK